MKRKFDIFEKNFYEENQNSFLHTLTFYEFYAIRVNLRKTPHYTMAYQMHLSNPFDNNNDFSILLFKEQGCNLLEC